MIRTMVYLDDTQPKLIQVISEATKKSQSQIIREALYYGLKQLQSEHKGNAKVFMGLIKLGKKLKVQGPKNLSSDIDDYLYGDK